MITAAMNTIGDQMISLPYGSYDNMYTDKPFYMHPFSSSINVHDVFQ